MNRSHKAIILIAVLFLCFSISACDFVNKPLIRKMVSYYSNSSNYEELQGDIVSIVESDKQLLINVKITSDSSAFTGKYDSTVTNFQFRVFAPEETAACILQKISVGDKVSFKSAPNYFFTGQIWPVVDLTCEGECCLSYEDGAETLLKWVNNYGSGEA